MCFVLEFSIFNVFIGLYDDFCMYEHGLTIFHCCFEKCHRSVNNFRTRLFVRNKCIYTGISGGNITGISAVSITGNIGFIITGNVGGNYYW